MSRAADIRLAAVVRNCTDGMLWYADHIGEQFELYAPFTGGAVNTSDGWRVWTNPGVNFIRLKDAEITPLHDGERIYPEPLPPAPVAEAIEHVRGYWHQCRCGHGFECVSEFCECQKCERTTQGRWHGRGTALAAGKARTGAHRRQAVLPVRA